MTGPLTNEDRLADLLAECDRVVVFGGPNVGKSTLCEGMVDDRALVQTDDWKGPSKGSPAGKLWEPGMGWDDVPFLARDACCKHERFVLEGVRALGAVREGLQIDGLLYLTLPKDELSKGQASMVKACETKMKRWWKSRPSGVVVVCEESISWM
jgi:hypothetical protein